MGTEVLSDRAIIAEFFKRLEQAAGNWAMDLSFYASSDQAGEDYKWIGSSPAFREWIGGRYAKAFSDQGIRIDNKPWESTLRIDTDDLRRAKNEQILVRIREMADRAGVHWARLISTLILAAEAAVCYDGQYFFDTDHDEGDSGTQSNDISVDISALPVTNHGTTTAPSPAEVMHVILEAAQAILGFKDDQGEPMNEMARRFKVMVPIPFWKASLSAIATPTIDGGDTNVIVSADGFDFQIVPNARLTWTTKLAVFRADGNVKPFIRQEEVPIQTSMLDKEFEERAKLFGAYASGNVGYGFWQHACLATLV
jgi:phage major head subunit gpT-like protein